MEKLILIITEQQNGHRLDKALLALFPHASTRERRRIWDSWQVLVNGKVCSAGHAVTQGDRISFGPKEVEPQESNAPWPHTDSALHRALAALHMPYCIGSYMQWHFFAKPSGLHTVRIAGGGKSLEDILALAYFKNRPFFVCNRLDAHTSGIVVVSETEGSVHVWQELENAGRCQKKYLALVHAEQGEVTKSTCVRYALDTHKRKISKVLAQEAPSLRHTHFQPLGPILAKEYEALREYFPAFPQEFPAPPLTLMGCTIQKGARHQIRAHAAHAGFPLFQDLRYIQRTVPQEESFLLHHGQLEFTLRGGEAKQIRCPAPWQEIFHDHEQVQDFFL